MRELQLMMYSLVAAILLGKILIPYFQRLKVGQSIREEGPKSHLVKGGTPTMGGFIFIIASLIVTAFTINIDLKLGAILGSMVAFGSIGFADDYIKVVLKRNLGLRAKEKLIGQFVFSGILAFIGYQISSAIWIPFTDYYLELGLFYIPFMMFVIIGTTNAVNLTDGLDGLNTSVTIIVSSFFLVATAMLNIANLESFLYVMIAALFGFLLFNKYPAKVFMGDLGSLGLGGFVVATAIVTNTVLLLPIVGIIYFAETISVILQVAYFKRTKKKGIIGANGKPGVRLFKMAPLHHHYEHCGWSEVKIVLIFSVITAVMSGIGYLTLLARI